ncbi:hypothetical protein [Natranaeroarchaeum sulfidigenes]|uniref:Uncharacterized protein n=1 Tax=Natranaeroarchaeum sulfidigenes TaxID=2784880 RepID=A0A897MUQ9_9EURY|nr:hypothetical protein [Natranaeroarchaeum sulfidigenes]QSG03758.1 hypothetical protein AArcS_2562 [Natranaeroarchaeum sulfidigenes]
MYSAIAGTLWFAFTLLLLALLYVDQRLAPSVAVDGSLLSGLVIVVYFVYVYDGPDSE